MTRRPFFRDNGRSFSRQRDRCGNRGDCLGFHKGPHPPPTFLRTGKRHVCRRGERYFRTPSQRSRAFSEHVRIRSSKDRDGKNAGGFRSVGHPPTGSGFRKRHTQKTPHGTGTATSSPFALTAASGNLRSAYAPPASRTLAPFRKRRPGKGNGRKPRPATQKPGPFPHERDRESGFGNRRSYFKAFRTAGSKASTACSFRAVKKLPSAAHASSATTAGATAGAASG